MKLVLDTFTCTLKAIFLDIVTDSVFEGITGSQLVLFTLLQIIYEDLLI